jgi:hypothetical protein
MSFSDALVANERLSQVLLVALLRLSRLNAGLDELEGQYLDVLTEADARGDHSPATTWRTDD